MGKIARFVGNLLAFGSAATGTNRTVFGDVTQSDVLADNINADFLAGWEAGVDLNGFPPRQFFNAATFTATQLTAYLHQMGVAEYDSAQEYHIGSFVNASGVLYSSLTNTNVGNPVTDTANWKKQDPSALLGGATETELTIATGSITPTQANHNVDTESDAASDDLTNIVTTNIIDNGYLVIRPNNTSRTIVVKDQAGGAGQIHTLSGADVTLDDTIRIMWLQRRGADFYEIYSSIQTGVGLSPAYYKHGLIVANNATNPNYQIDIDADELVLTDTGGNKYLAESVNLTVDLTVAGANGLDTGTEAVSTMYYLWVIYNPTTATVAGLLSLSSTTPTMPSGYTYKRRVGECYNDSGGNIIKFNRAGDKVWLEDPAAIYTATTLLTASYTQYSLPGQIPSGATGLELEASVSDATYSCMQVISPDNTPRFEVTTPALLYTGSANGGPTGGYTPAQLQMKHLGATSIYAKTSRAADYANQNLHVWGYELGV